MTEQVISGQNHGNIITDPGAVEQERLRRQYVRIDEKLAAERQEQLDALFHIDDAFAAEHPEEVAQLKVQFLEQKQGLNLGECFELSLQSPFFGQVNIVKLASTDHSEPNSSEKLFHETNDFLSWLKTQGPLRDAPSQGSDGSYISEGMGDDVVREALSHQEDPGDKTDRLKSGRWMEYELFDDEDGELEHQVAIIWRIRPFARALAEINGTMCSVTLFKETAFSVRTAALAWLKTYSDFVVANEHHVIPSNYVAEKHLIPHSVMLALETWLYTPAGDDPTIQRHRHHTAIYSSVVPCEVDQTAEDFA